MNMVRIDSAYLSSKRKKV